MTNIRNSTGKIAQIPAVVKGLTMEFEIKNAEFQQKTAQEVRIRSDSGNGVDQPQAVTVSVKAEALLYAAFAVLVALIYLVVQRRPAIR